jgi:phosphoribosyl 1,2-cyclic phosphodiesterase
MRVRFWGARGSIPTPMSEKQLLNKIRAALLGAVGVDLTNADAVDRYIDRLPPEIYQTAGGNTSCVEVRMDDLTFILDCGSGLRSLGNDMMSGPFGRGQGEAHVLITHTHWDHIQGFPFFTPAFIPGNRFHFYSPFPDLQMRFEDQQREVYFPVTLDYMRSTRTWTQLDMGRVHDICGVKVELLLLHHPGGAFAYRLSYKDKVLVYATDGEYPQMDEVSTRKYVEFFRDADLLIFDAQFSFDQLYGFDKKSGWGHSTPKAGAELAYRAKAKRLALTHHDPLAEDSQLWDAVIEAYNYLTFRARNTGEKVDIQVLLAREGLIVDL